MKIYFTVLISFFLTVVSSHGADHAVVLLYHHVSTETPASTSISPQAFQEHLEYLETNDFKVLPLSQILKSLDKGNSLPDNTVSITFDDAYRSVLENALPLLKKRNWPFTVFVNTAAVDKGYRNYLNWHDLRVLLKSGAEFGNHSHNHFHLVRKKVGESDEQWRTRTREDLTIASSRLEKELGITTKMFAYPYGEYTPELKAIVDQLGYFGIAQQSGAVGFGFDRLAVPRFPMATNYADMQRFATSVNSRPLPVEDVWTGPVVLQTGSISQNKFEFTLLPGDYQEHGLACFSSSGERLELEKKIVQDGWRISIRLPEWQPGRRKVNCTAPSLKEKGVYYWHSNQWLVKKQDGQWYTE